VNSEVPLGIPSTDVGVQETNDQVKIGSLQKCPNSPLASPAGWIITLNHTMGAMNNCSIVRILIVCVLQFVFCFLFCFCFT
jgi:hypothetical protein